MDNKKLLVTAIVTGAVGGAAAAFLLGTRKGKELLEEAKEYVEGMDLNLSDLLNKIKPDGEMEETITGTVSGVAKDLETGVKEKVNETKGKAGQ